MDTQNTQETQNTAPVQRDPGQRARAKLAEIIGGSNMLDVMLDAMTYTGTEELCHQDHGWIAVLLSTVDVLRDDLLAFCEEGRQ